MRGLSKTFAAAFGRKPHSPFLKSGGLPTAAAIFIFAIRVYHWTISPAWIFLLGASCNCRFTPRCSQYAMDAIRERGVFRGVILAAGRICRCHPWANCGHDPVSKTEARAPQNHINFHG